MRPTHPDGRLRRGSAFAVLGVVLAIATLSLSQCRMVEEKLTGVSLSKASADKCMSTCARAFAESTLVQTRLHLRNTWACRCDSLCLAVETLRFRAALQRIQAGRKACQADCRHQGRGCGGR
jgi:hypothetical protein